MVRGRICGDRYSHIPPKTKIIDLISLEDLLHYVPALGGSIFPSDLGIHGVKIAADELNLLMLHVSTFRNPISTYWQASLLNLSPEPH